MDVYYPRHSKVVQEDSGIDGGEKVFKPEARVLKECEEMSLRDVSQEQE